MFSTNKIAIFLISSFTVKPPDPILIIQKSNDSWYTTTSTYRKTLSSLTKIFKDTYKTFNSDVKYSMTLSRIHSFMRIKTDKWIQRR